MATSWQIREGLDGVVVPQKASPNYVPIICCGLDTLKELGKSGLLKEHGKGARFVLSDAGQALARELME